MRFIHASDLHIDSPLDGLSSHADAPAELLRTATRTAFTRLVDAAIEHEVAFLALPGDIYDGDWRDYNTGYFFTKEMARLKRHDIRVYLLYGNHDAENDMTKRLPMPDNVFAFGSEKAESFRFERGDVRIAVHGQSFRQAATVENLVPGYPARVAGHLNIGLLHTALEGHQRHAHYAPCTVDELRAKGYDAWLLGHVHEHQVLSTEPWIAYSGNLQGRSVRETGPRGALLFQIEAGRLMPPERLYVDAVRWAVARIDISACVDRAQVVAAAREHFGQIVREAQGRPVACRVVFEGRSRAHADLFGQARALRAELMAEALIAGGDQFWIERIKVDSEPAMDPAAISAQADAVAEMQSLLAEAARDPEFLASLKREFAVLMGKMGAEFDGQDMPAFNAARAGDFAPLIESVTPTVLERVAREG